VLPGKRFLAAARDVDLAQLAVDRRWDQVEVPTERAEALHAEKVQTSAKSSMGFLAENP